MWYGHQDFLIFPGGFNIQAKLRTVDVIQIPIVLDKASKSWEIRFQCNKVAELEHYLEENTISRGKDNMALGTEPMDRGA